MLSKMERRVFPVRRDRVARVFRLLHRRRLDHLESFFERGSFRFSKTLLGEKLLESRRAKPLLHVFERLFGAFDVEDAFPFDALPCRFVRLRRTAADVNADIHRDDLRSVDRLSFGEERPQLFKRRHTRFTPVSTSTASVLICFFGSVDLRNILSYCASSFFHFSFVSARAPARCFAVSNGAVR